MKNATVAVMVIALWVGISVAGEKAGVGNVPKVLLLGSLSKVYEPVRFNHSGHVSTAGGCADCHHQHGSMDVQSCTGCHRIDPSTFKKSVNAGMLRPCRECHPASVRTGAGTGRPTLKAAYHQACFKCHRGDVGTVGKDPKGCTEMCHLPAAQARFQEKK
ncbi:MAG: cytochrome c3 family protein [Deltaproteobacteria bacterium]|nr:cytochrome c3 family protein [Candidatus Deferrimicrobiaceae bacterium]